MHGTSIDSIENMDNADSKSSERQDPQPSANSGDYNESYSAHLLVVDDDKRLRDLLRQYLQEYGFAVSLACSAEEARSLLGNLRFDLLIVDILMPGESGLELARSLREREPTPILILSALGEPADRLQGLELGVADYMPKPFEPRELLLRIRKILAQEKKSVELTAKLKIGVWTFETKHGLLTSDKKTTRLPASEANLLRALAMRQGAIVSRSTLAHLADITDSPRAIDIAIARLRSKLEDDPKVPRYITTHRSKGYSLQVEL